MADSSSLALEHNMVTSGQFQTIKSRKYERDIRYTSTSTPPVITAAAAVATTTSTSATSLKPSSAVNNTINIISNGNEEFNNFLEVSSSSSNTNRLSSDPSTPLPTTTTNTTTPTSTAAAADIIESNPKPIDISNNNPYKSSSKRENKAAILTTLAESLIKDVNPTTIVSDNSASLQLIGVKSVVGSSRNGGNNSNHPSSSSYTTSTTTNSDTILQSSSSSSASVSLNQVSPEFYSTVIGYESLTISVKRVNSSRPTYKSYSRSDGFGGPIGPISNSLNSSSGIGGGGGGGTTQQGGSSNSSSNSSSSAASSAYPPPFISVKGESALDINSSIVSDGGFNSLSGSRIKQTERPRPQTPMKIFNSFMGNTKSMDSSTLHLSGVIPTSPPLSSSSNSSATTKVSFVEISPSSISASTSETGVSSSPPKNSYVVKDDVTSRDYILLHHHHRDDEPSSYSVPLKPLSKTSGTFAAASNVVGNYSSAAAAASDPISGWDDDDTGDDDNDIKRLLQGASYQYIGYEDPNFSAPNYNSMSYAHINSGGEKGERGGGGGNCRSTTSTSSSGIKSTQSTAHSSMNYGEGEESSLSQQQQTSPKPIRKRASALKSRTSRFLKTNSLQSSADSSSTATPRLSTPDTSITSAGSSSGSSLSTKPGTPADHSIKESANASTTQQRVSFAEFHQEFQLPPGEGMAEDSMNDEFARRHVDLSKSLIEVSTDSNSKFHQNSMAFSNKSAASSNSSNVVVRRKPPVSAGKGSLKLGRLFKKPNHVKTDDTMVYTYANDYPSEIAHIGGGGVNIGSASVNIHSEEELLHLQRSRSIVSATNSTASGVRGGGNSANNYNCSGGGGVEESSENFLSLCIQPIGPKSINGIQMDMNGIGKAAGSRQSSARSINGGGGGGGSSSGPTILGVEGEPVTFQKILPITRSSISSSVARASSSRGSLRTQTLASVLLSKSDEVEDTCGGGAVANNDYGSNINTSESSIASAADGSGYESSSNYNNHIGGNLSILQSIPMRSFAEHVLAKQRSRNSNTTGVGGYYQSSSSSASSSYLVALSSSHQYKSPVHQQQQQQPMIRGKRYHKHNNNSSHSDSTTSSSSTSAVEVVVTSSRLSARSASARANSRQQQQQQNQRIVGTSLSGPGDTLDRNTLLPPVVGSRPSSALRTSAFISSFD